MKRVANLIGALGTAIFDAELAAMTTASGLDASEVAALNAIAQSPGCTVTFVATVVDLTHPAAVRIVNRLETAGLVERQPGADGRTVALRLTADGRSRWQRQRRARADLLNRLVAGLPPSAQEALEAAAAAMLSALTTDQRQSEHLCRLCDEASCLPSRCPVTLAVLP
jgi:MarR family transcriptional regulator, negative regulator of the multidrug operon emrRAB